MIILHLNSLKLIVESATYSDCVDRFNYDSSLRDLKAACIVIIRLTTLPSSTTTQVTINLTVNKRNFLVFGPGAGDSVLTKTDDLTFGPFPISEAISYFDSYYSSYYILINGYIKFSSYGNRKIYPYNIDLDTRYSGNILKFKNYHSKAAE